MGWSRRYQSLLAMVALITSVGMVSRSRVIQYDAIPASYTTDIADPADTVEREAAPRVLTLTANASVTLDIPCKKGKYLTLLQPILDTDVPGGAWPKGANVFMEAVIIKDPLASASEPDIAVYRHPLIGGSRWPAAIPGIVTDSSQRIRVTITAGTTDENGNSLSGAKVRFNVGWRNSKPPASVIPNREPREFRGTVRFVSPANPGAGADISLVAGTKVMQRLAALSATFTASAIAANRYLNVVAYSNGGAIGVRSGWYANAITALQAPVVNAGPGLPHVGGATVVNFPFVAAEVPAGGSFLVTAYGKDAGDTWTSITATLEEWVTP